MPLNDERRAGYIRTPVELDAAARALDRALSVTLSPQKRFLLVVDFWGHTRTLPPSWLSGYLIPISPLFLDLLRIPSLSNVPAPVWRDAYRFLEQISKQGWHFPGVPMQELQVLTLEHTIRSHAYVSALRELHQFLVEAGALEGPLDTGEWTAVFGASTSTYGVFKAYVAVLQERRCRSAAVFARVLQQWQEYRQRKQSVAVVLLEADSHESLSTGRVQLMDILPQDGVRGESSINNLLGDQGHETIEQLRRAQSVAESFVASRFGKTPPHRRYHFSLHETSVALVGGSLGCAAAAGVAAGLTQQLNLPQRWTLSNTICCAGSLAPDGTVEAGSWEVMENKLRVAFYSPLEKIVIPALHREAALLFVQQLQRLHPHRRLDVLGVTRFSDLFEAEGPFTVINRGRGDRAREFVSRYSVPLLLLLILILFGGGGYFAYRAYYDYPNLEHAMGLRVGPSSIVYNPKDSLTWCFRDEKQVIDNNVGFGDLEVGDGFTRQFWIWNMTPSDLELRLSIEGGDSADWYINSGETNIRIASAERASIGVMFAPLSDGSRKRAVLHMRDPDTGESRYALHFEGSAGPPLSAGYALRFDGADDQLHFGERSTAFDITATATKEATFECWIRPTAPVCNAMILHNGQSRERHPDIEDLFIGFVSPDTLYYRVGSEIRMFVLRGDHVAAVGRWLHLAVAISVPYRKITVYLNGDVIDDRHADFVFDGPGNPFVTIGARNTGTASDLHFQGDIDEIRLWHVFRSKDEIKRFMRRRVRGLTPGLAGYWDIDTAVENTVFNANKRAHSGTLMHRPLLVRSDLGLSAPSADCRLVSRRTDRRAVELSAGRYLVAVRPVLPKRTDATFAFWFLQTAQPAIHFNYVLRDRGWISVENDMLFTVLRKQEYVIEPGWHLGACTVTADGRTTFHLDGKPILQTRTVPAGMQDWHSRFEGMMLGFRFDKVQQLASKYYDWYHPTLSHDRSYGALHVWARVLSDAELASLYSEDAIPRKGLVASWPLERLPDRDNNFLDEIAGHLLHIKQVRSWE